MKKFGIIALISAIFLLGVFSVISSEKEQTAEDVMKTVTDKYEVQGYIIGEGESPTIDVDLYKEEDIEKVEKYITSNLSDKDLKHYDIKVFSGWDARLEK